MKGTLTLNYTQNTLRYDDAARNGRYRRGDSDGTLIRVSVMSVESLSPQLPRRKGKRTK